MRVNRMGIINPRKILIRGTNWVGDAVMSVPAMKEIRRIFPDAHISLLVRPWVCDVYGAVEFVDEILEYDKQGIHRGLSGFRRLIAELKNRQFDLAILLQNAFEAAFIAWCARIPRRIGYACDGRSILLTDACPIDPMVSRMHQVYYYLDILSLLGLPLQDRRENTEHIPSIAIGVRDTDRQAAKEILRAKGIEEGNIIVGINPGAFYGEAKRWFADRYAETADVLAGRHGARIVLFGSPTDRAVVEQVAARMKHPAVILAGQTTLGQLMGLLKECSLLITNDSGPMHLAAALDVPQLALFGSTSEIATGPLNRQAVVIKHQVDCNPCFLRKCPTDFRCMKGISVQEAAEAAQGILEKQIGNKN
jgi:heptosyltransferase II